MATNYTFKFSWNDLSEHLDTNKNTLRARLYRWGLKPSDIKDIPGFIDFIYRCQACKRGRPVTRKRL